MTYRTPDNFDEDDLTVRPRGWELPKEYRGYGRPEDNDKIRAAGWCPECKEKFDECICVYVVDIFDNPEEEDNGQTE